MCVGHETSIPSIEKVSASSFSSRGLFFSSIWTVRPRYARSDNCPISEKKSPLSEKEVGPWPFPLGDILVSGPTEHLFCMIENGTFLHALFWQSVWKICPSVIWYFSWVSRLKNMESRMFLARGRRPRAEIIRDSMFFNRDTQGKLSNFTRTDFPTH